MRASFQGTAQAFQAALANEPILILAAVITVYIVLGVLYESYIHPVTILSTLPSAGVGAILALLLCRTDLSLIALIGIILLIGIVKKNAIMMIDFALEAEREQGKSPDEAIYQACLLRFRPIMMTTMAALLGGVPLAFGSGTGAELRQPLGITIVGGLILSQILTLYTTPVVYLYFDRLGRRARRAAVRRSVRAGAGAGGLMNISEPFIRRPVATSLLSVALLLAGLLAYRMLPVAPLPQVEFPVIQVQAQLPGASPETMAASVATPLERQFARIAGVTEMTSTSLLGATTIVLQFDLDRSIDAAARDVQAAINAARSQLPPNLPNNPNYRKVNPADAPILILALTSDALPVGRMFDAADSVAGAEALAGGGRRSGGRRGRCRVRRCGSGSIPNRLAQLGIGLGQVRTALGRRDRQPPKGELSDATSAWSVSANDQLFDADQYRPVIITYRNGAPVRLGDIAEVESSVEDVRTAGLANGKRAVLLIVYRQPGANMIETVDRVLELMPELRGVDPARDQPVGGPRPHHDHPRLRSATSRSRCCCPSRWWSSWCSSSCAACRPR